MPLFGLFGGRGRSPAGTGSTPSDTANADGANAQLSAAVEQIAFRTTVQSIITLLRSLEYEEDRTAAVACLQAVVRRLHMQRHSGPSAEPLAQSRTAAKRAHDTAVPPNDSEDRSEQDASKRQKGNSGEDIIHISAPQSRAGPHVHSPMHTNLHLPPPPDASSTSFPGTEELRKMYAMSRARNARYPPVATVPGMLTRSRSRSPVPPGAAPAAGAPSSATPSHSHTTSGLVSGQFFPWSAPPVGPVMGAPMANLPSAGPVPWHILSALTQRPEQQHPMHPHPGPAPQRANARTTRGRSSTRKPLSQGADKPALAPPTQGQGRGASRSPNKSRSTTPKRGGAGRGRSPAPPLPQAAGLSVTEMAAPEPEEAPVEDEHGERRRSPRKRGPRR